MNHIILGFSTDKKDWISTIIRKLTWSRFSHVVLMNPDLSSFIESVHGIGVRELPITEFFKRDNIELGTIPYPFPEKIWELAQQEIGKQYDELYVYGWLFHKNWQDDKKYACCELIPELAEKVGHPIIRRECFIKVTPELLYSISRPYKYDSGGI